MSIFKDQPPYYFLPHLVQWQYGYLFFDGVWRSASPLDCGSDEYLCVPDEHNEDRERDVTE